jgi:hypothetical protein
MAYSSLPVFLLKKMFALFFPFFSLPFVLQCTAYIHQLFSCPVSRFTVYSTVYINCSLALSLVLQCTVQYLSTVVLPCLSFYNVQNIIYQLFSCPVSRFTVYSISNVFFLLSFYSVYLEAMFFGHFS